MTFSTIFTVVIIGYIFFYLGMIGYDMFIRKDAIDLIPKHEDEDIDISDEAGSFKPIKVERAVRKPKMTEQQPDCNVPPSVKSSNGSSYNKETAKGKDDGDEERIGSKESQGKTGQTVVNPPEKQSEQNTVGFDDDQPKNRKPLNVQPDDITSDMKELDNQTFEASKKSSITYNNNNKEISKEDIIPPKLDLPDNEKDGHTVMELDFEDESIPYVRIDEDAAMTKMTGGINIEEMLEKARELSESGADSEFGKVMAEWKVYEMEKDKEGAEELRLLMSDNSNCGDMSPPVFDIE